MTLKQKIESCCNQIFAELKHDGDLYENLLQNEISKSNAFAKISALTKFMSRNCPAESLDNYIRSQSKFFLLKDMEERSRKLNKTLFEVASIYAIFNQLRDNPDEFLDLIPKELRDGAIQVIDETTCEYLLDDEKLEPSYVTKEISDIKNNLSREDQEKYKDTLKYAERVIFAHDNYSFQQIIGSTICEALEKHQNKLRNDIVLEKYNGTIDYTNGNITVIDKNNIKLQDLLQEEYVLSKEYKDNLKEAFKIFAQMEKDTGKEVKIAEEGTKIYGFFGYDDARKKLYNAIKSGNIEDIQKGVNQHQKAMNQLEELSEIVQNLNPDKTAFTGNIEISRNSEMPMKYIKDLPLNSKINTLHVIYSGLKESGLTVDEFLNNPGAAFNKIIEHDLDNYIDLNKRIRGEDNAQKSISDVLRSFNNNPAYTYKSGTAINVSNYGVNRLYGSVSLLEPNDNFKKDLVYASVKYELKNRFAFELLLKNSDLFSLDPFERNKTKGYADLLANYFLFNDKERDYNLLNANEGYIDPKTFKYIPPFNRQNYLRENEIDLAEINSRILDTVDKMIISPLQDSQVEFTSQEVILQSINKVAKDILEEKNALSNTPEYKMLKEIAKDPVLVCKNLKQNDMKQAKSYFENVAKDLKKEEEIFEQKYKSANDLDKQSLKEERFAALKQSFLLGDIPAKYFIERSRQLVNNDFGKLPPFFEIDKFPSQKEYIKNMDLEDLSKEDQKDTYLAAKERAQFEKNHFMEDWVSRKNGINVEVDDPEALLRAAGVGGYADEAEQNINEPKEYRKQLVLDGLNEINNQIKEIDDMGLGIDLVDDKIIH